MAHASNNRRAAARRAARKQAGKTSGKQTGASSGKRAGTSSGKQPPSSSPSKSAKRQSPVAAAPAESLSGGRRLAWWALVAMVFVVPLAMSNFTFLGFRLPFTDDQYDLVKAFFLGTLGLVALAAWSWDLLRRGGRLRRTPVDWLVLAFVGWAALTTVTSVQWSTSFFGQRGRYEGLLSFVTYALIYFLVLQLVESTARLRALARALFFSSLIVAGYGVLQFLGLDPIEWGDTMPFETNRAFATYGNPILLGGFLIFPVTVALALALSERRLSWRLTYWAGFALNALALIVSFTRGAWIGAALSFVLLVVIAWRQGARADLRRLDWLPAGLTAALGVGVIWRSLSSSSEVLNFGKRLGSIFEFSSGSGQTRTEIWQAAASAIEERPILGWGADTFSLPFARFKPVEYVRDAGPEAFADNAHNYPLHLAAGVGIPGALMMAGVFVWAGVRSFATVFGRRDDMSQLILGAFWAAAAGYLLQLFFGVSAIGSTFLLWIALGVVLVPTARVVQVRPPRWGSAAAVAVVVLAALGVGYQGVLMAAENAYLEAQSNTGAARTEAARRAVKLNPLSITYRTEAGLAATAELREYAAAVEAAQQTGQDAGFYAAQIPATFDSAETAFRDALDLAPNAYDTYSFLADLYLLGGLLLDPRYYGEAVTVARQGLELDPMAPAIRGQIAVGLLNSGQTDDGIAELENVMRIAPSYGKAALPLAQAYEVQKRPAKALALLKSVEALAPGQPGIAEAIQRLEADAAK